MGRARASLLLHVARLLRRPRAGRRRVGQTYGDRAARDSTAGETNLDGRLCCDFTCRPYPRGDRAQLPRLAWWRCGIAFHCGTLWGDALVAVAAKPFLAERMARRFCIFGGLRAAGLVAVAKRGFILLQEVANATKAALPEGGMLLLLLPLKHRPAMDKDGLLEALRDAGFQDPAEHPKRSI